MLRVSSRCLVWSDRVRTLDGSGSRMGFSDCRATRGRWFTNPASQYFLLDTNEIPDDLLANSGLEIILDPRRSPQHARNERLCTSQVIGEAKGSVSCSA